MPDITVTLTQDEVDLIVSRLLVERWNNERDGLDVSVLSGIIEKLEDAWAANSP